MFSLVTNWLFKHKDTPTVVNHEVEPDKYGVGEKIKIYLSYKCGTQRNLFGARICKQENRTFYKDSVFITDEGELFSWILQHKPREVNFIVHVNDKKAAKIPNALHRFPWYTGVLTTSWWGNKFTVTK